MVVHVCSVAFNGIDVVDVDVQVNVTPGIPQFTIVGLGDKAITESKERVKSALVSMGLALPNSKILVNLAPADLVKEGSHYDLPIALGILAAMKIISKTEVTEYIVLGELSLDGAISPISGALPASMGAVARDLGIICPKVNGSEAAWSGCMKIIGASSLLAIVNHFNGDKIIPYPEASMVDDPISYPDFSDIIGQERAKKAIEIAAAGGHNLLMYGPPGTGKSMLAQRMPGILPGMDVSEILECSTIYSIAGMLKNGALERKRPFRAPHHTCSAAAMVGGGVGKKVKPGEISLAHNGVLFLDELPEFTPSVLESLRQPIETREVLISRANSHIKFPSNFQLIAAMNPCKCGYFFDNDKSCAKAPRCSTEYMGKISGPMLDRFDINVEVGDIDITKFNMMDKTSEEKSSVIYERVKNAREIQRKRLEGYNIRTNSEMDGNLLTDYAAPDNAGLEILNEAAVKYKFSMRGYNRVLKVARTIADLSDAKNVSKIHVAEAISYRNFQDVVRGGKRI